MVPESDEDRHHCISKWCRHKYLGERTGKLRLEKLIECQDERQMEKKNSNSLRTSCGRL